MQNAGDNKEMYRGLSQSGNYIGKILLDVLPKAGNHGIDSNGEKAEVQNICYGVCYMPRANMQRVLERGVQYTYLGK
jgi:hypothetical protein